MGREFFIISFSVLLMQGVGTYYWPLLAFSFILTLPLLLMGLVDYFQVRHGVRRNFPVIGNLRYLMELVRPELQQYFVENNHDGRPISREFRSVVYQRAKGQLETLPFGTQRDVDLENHEWINHSMAPKKIDLNDIRVKVGSSQCKQPYSSSIFNISAMSYGSLSKNAIQALNLGASQADCYHNTGEGGISPYHRRGGDLVWQIGTAYFGCRTMDGAFDPQKFAEKSQWPEVKMIEIKVSQGAKPGKGGMLPGNKVSQEIADIRGVPVGKDVISPPYHTQFGNPIELLEFVQELRELSQGKPVGFKICVGRKSEFYAVCKAILKSGIYPDFITVDGAEGGTGAAPLEFSNSVGVPVKEGLAFVDNALRGFGLRKEIKIVASGKVFTSFHMLRKLALGADIVNSGRGMMLALGCIQALKCNSNHCPVGVATTNPSLVRGLDIKNKAERVARYHHQTEHALVELIGAMGYTQPNQVRRKDIFRRLTDGVVRNLEEIYPLVPEGSLLNEADLPVLRTDDLSALKESTPEQFQQVRF